MAWLGIDEPDPQAEANRLRRSQTRSHQERHLEVKGVSSSIPSILLTRNELRTAKTDPDWLLAVVTNAVTDPTLVEYERNAVTAAADPTVYRVNLAP